MKRIKSNIFAIIISFLIFILIIDSKTAMGAAYEGIQLCINTTIPSLFPISVLSALLTTQLLGNHSKLSNMFAKLCKMPPGSESIFLMGLISGYPIGAKNTIYAHQNGYISTQTAKRMLMFCSNCGPAFIFGICMPLFTSNYALWLLWLVQILSAVLVANINSSTDQTIINIPNRNLSITQVISSSLQAMAAVSGWIILFKVVLAFMDSWFLFAFSPTMASIIKCTLELTNGIISLKDISNEGMRFILCATGLSFGGVCVLMQTATLAGSLGIKAYIIGKLQQTILSLVLSAIVFLIHYQLQYGVFVTILSMIIFSICVIILQKPVEISRNIIYNTRKNRRGTAYVVSEKYRAPLRLL